MVFVLTTLGSIVGTWVGGIEIVDPLTLTITLPEANAHFGAQIAELAPNMRRPETCERQRLPLTVELEIDGETVANIEAPPSGLWNDGPASIYERFDTEPGLHTITARLRDSNRTEGWDYVRTEDVTLVAGRYFTVTFRAETGGFVFQ